ncbi:uncharacterized protein LOC115212992 [Argonauta hians]
MPQILHKESHQNLPYQQNKHDDFLLVEVEAILRHPDPTKITVFPPFFPKGGEVYLYKSGPHDRRVKDNYWWVNRGNNFHSKSQKRHAIMKTYFSLKDRNGNKKSDCLNGFRRHIYRLADTDDDRRTLMLVHYLGDETLHKTMSRGSIKPRRNENGSNSHQIKVIADNCLEIIIPSVHSLSAANSKYGTATENHNRMILPQTKSFTQPVSTLRSNSDDMKNSLETMKHKATVDLSESVESRRMLPTKVRRINGKLYNIDSSREDPEKYAVNNQTKLAQQLWRLNQQNHSQVYPTIGLKSNPSLLGSALQNKEKNQTQPVTASRANTMEEALVLKKRAMNKIRTLGEGVKTLENFQNCHQLNMPLQQRKRLQQLQKSKNSPASLPPKPLFSTESSPLKKTSSLRVNTNLEASLRKQRRNPNEQMTSQSCFDEALEELNSSNCSSTDSKLQIDYMKLFEEASYLPQMGCDVFVLVSYPGCKPAYWGTKKYVQKFENSECLQPYVPSNCLPVKLKDHSSSESQTDNLNASQSADRIINLKKEPMDNISLKSINSIQDVTVKREIVEDTIDSELTSLADHNNCLGKEVKSVTRTNHSMNRKGRRQFLHKDDTFKLALQRNIDKLCESMHKTEEDMTSFNNGTHQNSQNRKNKFIANERRLSTDDEQYISEDSAVTVSHPICVKIEKLVDDFDNR